MRWMLPLLMAGVALGADPAYDLLIKGGHVIDAKNGRSGVMDVAIVGGKVARVARDIPATEAKRVADARGLYVTPGLIDMHAHVYTGTGEKSIAGDQSVYPDGFSFRAGVTTLVDAGTAGYKNFPDFYQRVISRAKTRVLALVNASAVGMATGENKPEEFDGKAMAAVAKAYPDVVVGFKVAHFAKPDWRDVEAALAAGREAKLPLMVDFGTMNAPRSIEELLRDRLRAGDIYTHCYSGLRRELTAEGKVNPAMVEGRKRGIIFDLGHGGGSFFWNIAVPAFEQGFQPDVISTDLHTGSMNGGMKDIVNVMSKVLNLGMSLEAVVQATTWNAAKAIHREELGHLTEGAGADVTVLRLEKGEFGFLDSAGARRAGTQRLTPEMTVRNGVVVWDLNGIAATDWKSFVYKKRN